MTRRASSLITATTLLVIAAAPASAPAAVSRYDECAAVPGTVFVGAARVACAEVEPVAATVAAAPTAEAAAVLAGQGWTATRVLPASGEAAGQFDLVAVKGARVLIIRRTGEAPSLDGWSAGRELVFARNTIVGGRPVPRGASFCTSAFLVRLGADKLGGLSAAHCGGLRSDGLVQRRNVALRRPPQPGVVLGRVLRILGRTKALDALVAPVPQGEARSAAPLVDRGIARPPWAVTGTARLLAGRTVCFTGRTSGIDRCGRLLGSSGRFVERQARRKFGVTVRCTTITGRPGDSGGPVYTAPTAGGTVRALGIVTLVNGLLQQMCFTPIQPVLDELDASLVTSEG